MKRQEVVEDEAGGNGDAGGNDPREDLGEAGDDTFTYSTTKTTARKYDFLPPQRDERLLPEARVSILYRSTIAEP